MLLELVYFAGLAEEVLLSLDDLYNELLGSSFVSIRSNKPLMSLTCTIREHRQSSVMIICRIR